jgi:hypothetical protein
VPFTGDVFGLTATDTTDMGIGQQWESFVDQMDVVLPMAYPSHYAPGTYKLGNPNAQPYATIANTLKDAKRRSAAVPNAAKLRPWYQDFTLGPPRYSAPQVRAQIKAGEDNGVPTGCSGTRGRCTRSARSGPAARRGDVGARRRRRRGVRARRGPARASGGVVELLDPRLELAGHRRVAEPERGGDSPAERLLRLVLATQPHERLGEPP